MTNMGRHLSRAWALTRCDIRTAVRRKLPLVLLYGLPAAWTIYFCSQIYIKYAALEGKEIAGGLNMIGTMIRGLGIDIEIRRVVNGFFIFTRLFIILVVAWFGSGLFCEDRRQRAHLLYFSRPLSRGEYILARFLTIGWFAALATLAPTLVLLMTAAWQSPDWIFVREEGEVIGGALAYSATVVAYYGSLILALSTLAGKKTHAMAALFGVVLLGHGVGTLLARASGDNAFRLLSPLTNLGRVADSILGIHSRFYSWPAWWSWAVVAASITLCAGVVVWRVRKWEMVA